MDLKGMRKLSPGKENVHTAHGMGRRNSEEHEHELWERVIQGKTRQIKES